MLFKHEPNYYLKTDIDRYFESKGIHVIYNGLMANELLMRAYVNDFHHMVERADQYWSHFDKNTIYQTMYPVKNRKKLTGFEKVSKLDAQKRVELRQIVKKSIFAPCKIQNHKENVWVKNCSYKDTLKNSVKSLDNPFLYLSGGADSELLAYAFLDAGVKFTPVIFKLIYDNECINHEEIKYAFDFCSQQKLIPITKILYINEFWNSHHFNQLAIGCNLLSPQILTHAHMVEVIDYEFPYRTHIFGGEVRYSTRHVYYDDDENQNIIYLDKAGFLLTYYNFGLLWESRGGPGSGSNYCVNYWNTYTTYANARYGGDSGAFSWTDGNPMTGTWYIQVSSITEIVKTNSLCLYGAQTSYISLGGGFSFVCSAVVFDGNLPASTSEWLFGVNVYGSNSPGIVGGCSIGFRAVNNF